MGPSLWILAELWNKLILPRNDCIPKCRAKTRSESIGMWRNPENEIHPEWNPKTKCTSKRLGEGVSATLDCSKYERWASEACTKMRKTFLLSPPDQLGYMVDEIFQVGITAYLRQLWDVTLAKVVSNLILICMVQTLLQCPCLGLDITVSANNFNRRRAMIKLGSTHSAAEVNFLVDNDKFRDSYIASYVNSVSSHLNAQKTPHAIVQDIHAFNFPSGCHSNIIYSMRTTN